MIIEHIDKKNRIRGLKLKKFKLGLLKCFGKNGNKKLRKIIKLVKFYLKLA